MRMEEEDEKLVKRIEIYRVKKQSRLGSWRGSFIIIVVIKQSQSQSVCSATFIQYNTIEMMEEDSGNCMNDRKSGMSSMWDSFLRTHHNNFKSLFQRNNTKHHSSPVTSSSSSSSPRSYPNADDVSPKPIPQLSPIANSVVSRCSK